MAFRLVCALWLAPDFSEVEAGRMAPPRVNHSQVDFAALQQFFQELFPYGPRVSIQVPNDTIDQVTVHMRQARMAPPSMRCEDFGKALLGAAKKQKGPVVDVRAAWRTLHVLEDRDFAPPPVILPFVVTAADFEDAMIWRASTRPSLGLPAFDVLEAIHNAPVEHEGALAPAVRDRLNAIFGAPFLAPAVLDEMCSDPPPAYVQGLRPRRGL